MRGLKIKYSRLILQTLQKLNSLFENYKKNFNSRKSCLVSKIHAPEVDSALHAMVNGVTFRADSKVSIYILFLDITWVYVTGTVKRDLTFEKIDFHFLVDSVRKKYALFNETNCMFWTALFILQMHFREEHSNLKNEKQISLDTKSLKTLFFHNKFCFLRVFFNFTSRSGLSNKFLVINNFKKSLG